MCFDQAKHIASNTALHYSTLQHTATQCNALQHTLGMTEMLWRTTQLQHTATHCNTAQRLQHTATPCNILQRTATHGNTLQHTAAHCSTLHRKATHCNALQHTWGMTEMLWRKVRSDCVVMSRSPMCMVPCEQVSTRTSDINIDDLPAPVLQRVAVICSLMQRVVLCCR